MTRHHHSFISAVAGCAMLSLVAAAPAIAQTSFRDTARLSFTEAVQVPGQTLEAGEYVFTIADKSTARSVVQIWNKDESQLITQAVVVPTRRMDDKGEIAVQFSGAAPGEAPALRAWFVPGQAIGHEFVYPEDQARRIAESSKMLVLSSDHDAKDLEGLAGATIYRVDGLGERRDYADPESWDDAPMMEPDRAGQDEDAEPKALIDDIEKIVEEALDKAAVGDVSMTRAELQKIQAHLEKLRAAITAANGDPNRRR